MDGGVRLAVDVDMDLGADLSVVPIAREVERVAGLEGATKERGLALLREHLDVGTVGAGVLQAHRHHAAFARGTVFAVVTAAASVSARAAATIATRASATIAAVAARGTVVAALVDLPVAVVVEVVAELLVAGARQHVVVVAITTARGETVAVLVESLVDAPIAVVVAPIAEFGRAGMHQGVSVVAVAVAPGDAVQVLVVPLVDLPVAVVVEAIAIFGVTGAREDVVVETIRRASIGVARIAGITRVEAVLVLVEAWGSDGYLARVPGPAGRRTSQWPPRPGASSTFLSPALIESAA